ncbi:MAG: 6-phosphogluconolactonase [Chitinophagaceae bacterium]
MQLHISNDADELAGNVADWIIELIAKTLETNDRFTIALSGGSTPKKLHLLLASPGYRENVQWEKLHFFWGDERAVPFSDDRNNAKMAFETLLDKVPVNRDNIYIMRTDIPPEESAAEYNRLLHEYFDGHPFSFDLVLLGMGDDGHTLSLFPGTGIVHETSVMAKAFYLDAQQMFRISLTAPIVNESTHIAFLVAGTSKAHALKEVLKGEFNPDKYPSQMIRPVNGELHWFLDKAAAADII